MPSVLTPDELRVLVDTDLEDPELQAVIDAEEAELAEEIGPLTGSRTELYTYPPARWGDPAIARVQLRRYTTADQITAVEDAGVAVGAADWLFTGGAVYRALGAFLTPIAVTYTPTDTARLKRAIAERIRWRLVDPTIDSESIGSYRYATGGRLTPADVEDGRAKALEQLLPRRRQQSTIRVLSATAAAVHYADPRINV